MEEFTFTYSQLDGRYATATNLWCYIEGHGLFQVNYTETEAQWAAKEFPHHILFISNELTLED